MAKSRRKLSKKDREPTFQGWITTDAEEAQRRRWRGRNESFDIQSVDLDQSYYSTYEVRPSSDRLCRVEIRDLKQLTNSCTCADYDANGLGTCKHIEGVLHHLHKAGVKAFQEAAAENEEPVTDMCGRLGGNDWLPAEFHHKALWLCGVAVDGEGGSGGVAPASQEDLPGGLTEAEALLSHVRERVSA